MRKKNPKPLRRKIVLRLPDLNRAKNTVLSGCTWIILLLMILSRTWAKLCHVNGGELEQIQFLLGHVSVLTTERYLGCKQNLRNR
jgi:hypothetical protein